MILLVKVEWTSKMIFGYSCIEENERMILLIGSEWTSRMTFSFLPSVDCKLVITESDIRFFV
jgi:hypothetical protein